MSGERSNVRANEVALLHVEGEFDVSNVVRFSAKVDGLIGEGYRALVLDLRRLRLADSVMLGHLIGVRESFRQLGGDVVLVGATSFVRRTIETLGLDEILTLAPSRLEALRVLVSPRSERPSITSPPAAMRITRVS
jgi:anti-anti-sigma factor